MAGPFKPTLTAFNPYFLECMSYKYDSVGMATSVFVSIVPFLFINKKYLYFVISLLSVFVMCTSYQASSGIYIMLVIFSGLISYLTDNDVTLKNIFSFFASSAIAYLVATVFFYILSTLFGAPYRDTSLVLNPILWINNFIALIRIVKFDFNIVWAVLTILVIVLSAITLVSRSKRNKVLAAILTAIAISVALFLSIGAYIFLTDGVESARMIYGVGVFIAILSVIATFNIFKTSLLAVPAILLSWVLFVYSFIYANALAAQGIEMIAPHRRNRKRKATQDGRPLRRYRRRWKIERLFAWLNTFKRTMARWDRFHQHFTAFVHLAFSMILLRRVIKEL